MGPKSKVKRRGRESENEEMGDKTNDDEVMQEGNIESQKEEDKGKSYRKESEKEQNMSKEKSDLFPTPILTPHVLFSLEPYLLSHELMHDEEVLGHFDGGCRDNGKSVNKDNASGFGFCFVAMDDGRWLAAVGGRLKTIKWRFENADRQLQITTNNRAEIVGEVEILWALINLKRNGAKFTRCHVVGDSEYAILEKTHDPKNRNHHLITFRNDLLETLKSLTDVVLHRVDRLWNTNADDCVNAGIDARPFKFVKPIPLNKLPTLQRIDITELLRVASNTRERTWRILPEEQRQSFWNATALLMRDAESVGLPPQIFCLLAPRILLRTTKKSHRKFNHIKRTLLGAQLSKISRVSIVIAFLNQKDLEVQGVYPNRDNKKLNCVSDSMAIRIHGHLAQRCPGKALKSADGGRTLQNTKEVLMQWKMAYAPKMVPNHLRHELAPLDDSLPTPLPQSSAISISSAMLSEAIRHSRTGAANGITGWTKELMPSGKYAHSVQNGLITIMHDIVNNSANSILGDFIRTAAGICFEQGVKKRTCGLRDYVMKTAWRIALLHTPVSPFCGTAQMMGTPHGSIKAARRIQASLDTGKTIIIGDAVHAHPWFSRRRAREALESRPELAPLYPIFNFTYCHPTSLKAYDEEGQEVFCLPILIGMLQGCTSAMKMFNLVQHHCAISAIPDYEDYTVFVADDSATEGETEEEAWSRFNKLADALEAGDIIIRGPKTKVLNASSEIQWHIYAGALVMIRNSKFPVPLHHDFKPLLRLKKRIDLIISQDLSFQDTLLLGIHVNKTLKYFLQATHPDFSSHYSQWIQDQLVRPFEKICGNKLPAHALVQLYASTDAAGFGMFDPCEARSIYDSLDDIDDHWKRMQTKFFLNCARNNVFKKSTQLVQYNKPWFAIYPTSTHCTLSNGAVSIALTLLLHLSQESPLCTDWSKSITPIETCYCDHLILCRTCGACWWKWRHNKTLYTLFNVATKFCVALQHDVSSLIGLTKTILEADATERERDEIERGKGLLPDGYAMMTIEGDEHLAAKLSFIDLTVCHWASSNKEVSYTHPIVQAYNHKILKYKNFLDWAAQAQTQQRWDDEEEQQNEISSIRVSDEYVTRPIVMTATGYASKSAFRFLKQLGCQAEKGGFAYMALSRMQVALLNAQASGINSSLNRKRQNIDTWKASPQYRAWKANLEKEQNEREMHDVNEGEN